MSYLHGKVVSARGTLSAFKMQQTVVLKNVGLIATCFLTLFIWSADDTIARLGFYQLAGSDKAYHSLLRFALNLTTLPDSAVIIVLDWSRPWTFISTLQRWIKVVEQAINSVKQEGESGSKSGWTKGKVLVEEMTEFCTFSIFKWF